MCGCSFKAWIRHFTLIINFISHTMKKNQKNTTLRKSLFLTLNNLEKHITFPDKVVFTPQHSWDHVEFVIKATWPKAKIIAGVEQHESGAHHMHSLIEISQGVRKNTLVKTFRDLFPTFEGHNLSVEGVRSKANTLAYILKEGEDRVYHTPKVKLKQVLKCITPDTLPPSWRGAKTILNKGRTDTEGKKSTS